MPDGLMYVVHWRFQNWEEKHFRSLPKEDTTRMRNVLMQKRVVLRAGPFPAFRALSEVILDRYSAAATAAFPKKKSERVQVNETWNANLGS